MLTKLGKWPSKSLFKTRSKKDRETNQATTHASENASAFGLGQDWLAVPGQDAASPTIARSASSGRLSNQSTNFEQGSPVFVNHIQHHAPDPSINHDKDISEARAAPFDSGPEIETQIRPELHVRVLSRITGEDRNYTTYCKTLWQSKDQFRRLECMALDHLKNQRRRPADFQEQIYLETGWASAVRVRTSWDKVPALLDGLPQDKQCPGDLEGSCFLDDEKQWHSQLGPLIATRLATKDSRALVIEVDLTFAALAISHNPNTSLASSVRDALDEFLVNNFRGQCYLPRKVLETIFRPEMVRKLVFEDSTLAPELLKNSPWQTTEAFARYVNLNAIALLALYIDQRIGLRWLLGLLLGLRVRGDRAVPLVHRALRDDDAPDGMSSADFRTLKAAQAKFFAHTFVVLESPRQGTRESLDTYKTVPIQFYPSEVEAEHHLGEGGYGSVDRVKIHPQHHHFAPDRSQCYAVKKIKLLGSAQRDPPSEEDVFRKLGKHSHENVVLHKAAWIQNDISYMLFQYADHGNLRDYMKKSPPYGTLPTRDLLCSLRGLASGLEYIHKAVSIGAAVDQAQLLQVPNMKQYTYTGCHFDLKPENILLFMTKNGLTWKIADFGISKIYATLGDQRYVTKKTITMRNGDERYSSPDFLLDQHISRPYDLFSLGAVYLEVLLWAWQLPNWQHDKLEVIVLQSPPPRADTSQNQALWFRHSNQSMASMKPAVIGLQESVRDSCKGNKVHSVMAKIMIEMMRLRSKDRPKAADVAAEFDRLINYHDIELEPSGDEEPHRGRAIERLCDVELTSEFGRSRSRNESLDRDPARPTHTQEFLDPRHLSEPFPYKPALRPNGGDLRIATDFMEMGSQHGNELRQISTPSSSHPRPPSPSIVLHPGA